MFVFIVVFELGKSIVKFVKLNVGKSVVGGRTVMFDSGFVVFVFGSVV